MIPILMPRSAHDGREVVDRLDREVADALADLGRVGVHEREHPEPSGAEAPVVGERLAEVAEPDDGDRPVGGEPELGGDPVDEELDLVADAPGAVGAEVGEVLADLRRVDPGELGEPLRGDGADVLVGGLEQGPVVERQARHRRLGDPPRGLLCAASRAVGHVPSGPLRRARVSGGPEETPYTRHRAVLHKQLGTRGASHPAVDGPGQRTAVPTRSAPPSTVRPAP